MKVLQIAGRRWFQKSYGNTYFTSAISIDGEYVHTIQQEYGYGQMYEQAAKDWLIETEHLPEFLIDHSLSIYCRENDIILISQAVDVQRQKDL